MRKFLLSLMVGATTIAMAQTKEVTLEMEPGYAKQVYYKFSDQSSHSYDKTSWDLAFYKDVSNIKSKGIRINGGNGLQVYEVSQDISKWNEIGISDESNWTALYNSDKSWPVGAFDNGSAEYGWGYYDSNDHHVYGSVIFIIKKGADYYKFMVQELFYTYKIKYAKWNSTTNNWGADMTAQIPFENDKYFNFFSFDTNAVVDAQPNKYKWDILFTKYVTDLTDNDGNVVKYNVTGVLQNRGIEVAEVEETTPTQNTEALSYSADIDVIGHDWKKFEGSYKMIENRVYYVKTITDRVYRLWFTEFGGYSTGKVKFNQTDTGELSTVDADGNVSFGVYPNPVTDNKISIVYDNKQDVASNAQVEIYNMAGQKVFATELSSSKGFYQREVNLGSLAKGVYILKFIYGGNVETEKLMVK